MTLQQSQNITVICVILFSIAHILSLQDVTIRSMFCALFYQIVCW